MVLTNRLQNIINLSFDIGLVLSVEYNFVVISDCCFLALVITEEASVPSASSHKWEAYRWLQKGLDVSVLSPK
jgi:hypothetical protein